MLEVAYQIHSRGQVLPADARELLEHVAAMLRQAAPLYVAPHASAAAHTNHRLDALTAMAHRAYRLVNATVRADNHGVDRPPGGPEAQAWREAVWIAARMRHNLDAARRTARYTPGIRATDAEASHHRLLAAAEAMLALTRQLDTALQPALTAIQPHTRAQELAELIDEVRAQCLALTDSDDTVGSGDGQPGQAGRDAQDRADAQDPQHRPLQADQEHGGDHGDGHGDRPDRGDVGQVEM